MVSELMSIALLFEPHHMFPSYFSTRLSLSPVDNDQSQIQYLIEMSKILHTCLGIVDFLEPLSSSSVPIQHFLVVVVV